MYNQRGHSIVLVRMASEVHSANMSNFFKIIPLSQYFSLANVCFGDSLDVGFDQVYESEFGQIKPMFWHFLSQTWGI